MNIDVDIKRPSLDVEIIKTGPKGDDGSIDVSNYDSKGTIVDNDQVSGFDSEASDNGVTWLWSVLKSAIASATMTLTNKTINADNNTVSNLAHGSEVDDPSSGVHGVTGSVVGTSDTQTLTNKTLGDNLDANSNKIINVTDPTNDQDASTKAYVDVEVDDTELLIWTL